ncbi:hypothetical protein OG21DRAFT_318638 [Imleria badia]|nr:hypothetical protein OG21DRAFT_318638 [Imleria badia]
MEQLWWQGEPDSMTLTTRGPEPSPQRQKPPLKSHHRTWLPRRCTYEMGVSGQQFGCVCVCVCTTFNDLRSSRIGRPADFILPPPAVS